MDNGGPTPNGHDRVKHLKKLLNLIIEELSDNTSWLKSCPLVLKLYISSQSHIFSSVRYPQPPSTLLFLPASTLEDHPCESFFQPLTTFSQIKVSVQSLTIRVETRNRAYRIGQIPETV
jgi:hypothetical protein